MTQLDHFLAEAVRLLPREDAPLIRFAQQARRARAAARMRGHRPPALLNWVERLETIKAKINVEYTA